MKHWLQLTRLQTSGLTMALLVITRWVAAGVDLFDTMVLCVAGILIHAGFFSMNEWADRDHDQGHPDKVNPVTAGRIPAARARALSLSALTLSLVILLWWGRPWSWTTIPLINSYLLGTSYNLRGKRYPRLAPVILAGWSFMLALWICGLSGFPRRSLWLPFAWGFMLWLQVLEGDLKDWDHDGRDRANLMKHHDIMDGVQCLFAISLLYASRGPSFWNLILFLLVLVLTCVCAVLLASVKQTRTVRSKMLRNMGIHNMAEYAMILLVVIQWVSPVALVVALVVPVLMYGGLNRLAYGRVSAPSI